MSKKLIIIIVVLILAGFGIFFMRRGGLGQLPSFLMSGTSSENSANNAEQKNEFGSATNTTDWERYDDPTYGFHFEYPKGLNVSSFSEDAGDTILVQGQIATTGETSSNDQNSSSQTAGFQIFVSPFDEPIDPAKSGTGPITKERILQDIPDMKIIDEQTVMLERDKSIPALIFFSESETGKNREVWFVHDSYLYQITASQGFDQTLSQIMATFSFQ